MRSFEVPEFYRSPIIGRVKHKRKSRDSRKQDFAPSVLDFGTVRFVMARHFGFCFGVENAIEIAYRALDENPGKRIFLLSQMIHNPEVNADLTGQGIRFLQDTEGNPLTPISELTADDVVLIPAFGTTLELEAQLKDIGVDVATYNTTCPFVEKVWKRSAKLATESYTIVIHGKPQHEETRATFSHARESGHALVVKNMAEAEVLCSFIEGQRPMAEFWEHFDGRTSAGFDPTQHLQRIGVVNQTTMLASDTQAISDRIKQSIEAKSSDAQAFANTRDTLCYATNDNQQATQAALAAVELDAAVVVGGYNSSNTSHLVELCEEQVPTFFVRNEKELLPDGTLKHFNWRTGVHQETTDPWPEAEGGRIPTLLLTSGASCPDATVDRVMRAILERYPGSKDVEEVLIAFEQELDAQPLL
jgi:4-hydroxy-3-methylbut-2-enyl diphosphate reductase